MIDIIHHDLKEEMTVDYFDGEEQKVKQFTQDEIDEILLNHFDDIIGRYIYYDSEYCENVINFEMLIDENIEEILTLITKKL